MASGDIFRTISTSLKRHIPLLSRNLPHQNPRINSSAEYATKPAPLISAGKAIKSLSGIKPITNGRL